MQGGAGVTEAKVLEGLDHVHVQEVILPEGVLPVAVLEADTEDVVVVTVV